MAELNPHTQPKPLNEACNGGLKCPVPEHVKVNWWKDRARLYHVRLTKGQKNEIKRRAESQ